MNGDRKDSAGGRRQAAQPVGLLLFSRRGFVVSLLLLGSHLAEPRCAPQLERGAFAKLGLRDCLDVESVCSRQGRLCALKLAVFFDGDGPVLREYYLWLILKGLQAPYDSPQPGLKRLPFPGRLAWDFDRDAAAGVAPICQMKRLALLRSSLSHRGHRYGEPHFLAGFQLWYWDVPFHIEIPPSPNQLRDGR